MIVLAFIINAYLLGCLNASFYLAKWLACVDIRTLGSGTAGSRNLLRQFGFSYAIVAFLWDGVKAFVAIKLVSLFGDQANLLTIELLVLCSVIMGHVWPVQMAWRGGKGLACLIGGLLAFDPILLVVCVILFLLLGLALRLLKRWQKPDIAVYLCLFFIPFVFFLKQWLFLSSSWRSLIVPVALLGLSCGIVLFAHRRNIQMALGHNSDEG